ncbi:MAG: glycosyltransferase family 4 protein [Candidatus Aphodocola sp.]
MSKKNIWFINQTAYLPEDGPHIRHFTFGKYMNDYGYNSFVFAGNELHHNSKKIDIKKSLFTEKIKDKVHFFYIKTTHYTKNNIFRIISILSFYFNIFRVARKVAKKYGKPDVIYASSMYPTALVAGIKLAKKYKIKCISENRDIVPDGFITKGGLKENSLLVKILRRFMLLIFKKSDAIVFTMSSGDKFITDMKWDKEHGGKIDINKVFVINNGVDLKEFYQNEKIYHISDEDLNDNSFKVVYLGSIRFLNNINLFVDVAEELKNRKEDSIKLLVWGTGTKIDEIKEVIKEKKLDNIIMKGYVEKKYIPSIATKADLFIGTGNSCSVDKYGISFNKLFDYFAAGKPIILPFKTIDGFVEKNGAGVELENATANDIADKIIMFKNMTGEEYKKYCTSSKNMSKEFDYSHLTKELNDIIENITN